MLTIEIIKTEIEPIAREYNMEKVYVFGSYAKGTQREDSDVDLLVENPKKMTLIRLSGFLLDVKEALQLPVDLVTVGSLSPEFNECIGEDRVLIYEKNQ